MYKFNRNLINWLLVAGTVFIGISAHAAGLNDTGITTCSNATQNGLPCPVAGFPGQDAEYGTNGFDFTKLDANGNEMSLAAANHSCVQDNVTGLMWEVKSDDGGLRDKDWSYTWYNSNSTDGNLGTPSGGTCKTPGRCDTEKFVADVNATNLCGHSDWRVPDIKELTSIVDYSIPGPVIDEEYFPNTPAEWFWSASPSAGNADLAWIVDFYYGYDLNHYRTYSNRVRLVCAGQVLSFVFVDNANGTVTDSTTGLIWAKCPLGQSGDNCEIGSATAMTWQQALQVADSFTLAGKSDWRLPNIRELRSIVDFSKFNPSINSSYFPNTPAERFWSASPYAYLIDYAWVVYFGDGYDDGGYRTLTNHVRFVCAEQVLPSTFTITPSAGSGGNVSPSTPRTVTSGATTNFTVTPTTGYTKNTAVSGTCPQGNWNGNVWTTGTITANCTVNFSFNVIPITAPTVTTLAATNIDTGSATLNGSVISAGATANVSFDFGTTTAYGTSIATTPAQVYSSSAVAVSASKTGLSCGTTHHYRTKAVNSAGTGYGVDKTFTAATCPPQPINGVCGTANGKTFSSAPTTNLCSSGTTTPVTGTGPWNWNCNGQNGGSNASCSANITAVNSWLAPPTRNVLPDYEFTLDVTAKSNSMRIQYYDFTITFDPNKLALRYSQCDNGICPGLNTLTTNSVSLIDNATVRIKGLGGTTGPGNDLQLLVAHFKSKVTLGATTVNLITTALENTSGTNIGLGSRGTTVNVTSGICGDATGDTVVNIIDALAVARKVIGLPPPPTIEPLWADVNKDNNVTIIDALHISRYSIGLVIPPEVCDIGQAL